MEACKKVPLVHSNVWSVMAEVLVHTTHAELHPPSFPHRYTCSIPQHDNLTLQASKQQVVAIKKGNCNWMTARCIQGIIMIENTFSTMSKLVMIKSDNHCVSELSTKTERCSPRRPEVTEGRPYGLYGSEMVPMRGSLSVCMGGCMCEYVCGEMIQEKIRGWFTYNKKATRWDLKVKIQSYKPKVIGHLILVHEGEQTLNSSFEIYPLHYRMYHQRNRQ